MIKEYATEEIDLSELSSKLDIVTTLQVFVTLLSQKLCGIRVFRKLLFWVS